MPQTVPDNPYESMPDAVDMNPSTGGGDPYGLYSMTHYKSGKAVKVPRKMVGDYTSQGYAINPEDRERFAQSAEGSVVVGRNAAGQPILGPAGPDTSSGGPGAFSRGLRGVWEQTGGAISGMYHGLIEGPQNPEEADIANNFGGIGLRFHRFVSGPMQAEYKKAKELQAQTDQRGTSVFTDPDRQLMYGHAIASALPLIGPYAAGTGESVGTKVANEDYAGATGVLAGAGLNFLAPKAVSKFTGSEFVTTKMPRRLVAFAIKPMAGDVKFGKDPVAAILNEKIVGNSLHDLHVQVDAKLKTVGQELDDLVNQPQNAGRTVNASSVLQPFDEAIREAKRTNNAPLYTKLIEQRMRLAYEFADVGGVLRPVRMRNMRMSPAAALTFKRMIGDQVKWTTEPLQGDLNQAFGAAYGKIKTELNDRVPGLEGLNERYANLVGAKKAISRRMPVDERNAELGLLDIGLIASGHFVADAALKVSKSPGFRTRAAIALHGLPRNKFIPPARLGTPIAMAAKTAERKPEDRTQAPPKSEANPYESMPDAASQDGASSPLAQAISGAEGFGADYSVGMMAKNPGNLELGDVGYGTMPAANGQQITIFGSVQDGWSALDKQIDEIYSGASSHYSPDMTLEQFGQIYSGDPAYGARLAATLGVDPSTTLGELREEAQAEEPPAAQPAAAPLPVNKAQAAERKPDAQPVSVTAPDGNEYVFQNQKAADQFKAAAGLS